LNSLDGQIIINYIKKTTDDIRDFIDQRSVAIDIEKRKFQEDVHELLDVKKNYTEVINANETNERELDLLYEYINRLHSKKELKGYSEKIKDCQKDWIKIYKQAENVKKELEVTVKSYKEKTNQKISDFEEVLKKQEKLMKNEN